MDAQHSQGARTQAGMADSMQRHHDDCLANAYGAKQQVVSCTNFEEWSRVKGGSQGQPSSLPPTGTQDLILQLHEVVGDEAWETLPSADKAKLQAHRQLLTALMSGEVALLRFEAPRNRGHGLSSDKVKKIIEMEMENKRLMQCTAITSSEALAVGMDETVHSAQKVMDEDGHKHGSITLITDAHVGQVLNGKLVFACMPHVQYHSPTLALLPVPLMPNLCIPFTRTKGRVRGIRMGRAAFCSKWLNVIKI